MVLGNVRNLRVESTIMESRSLKFGMDRILSNDTTSSNGKSEDFCNSMPPCAACIASLYRCCRTASTLGITNFYKNENHAYQSLRLLSNVSNPVPSNASENSQKANSIGNIPKRKKSWSRAVFSNLQRKGLEKRFQLQKYITKPDRRQLAATLGLTDAQVKVWFQNRRMKWRHARESSQTNSDVGGSSDLAFPVPNSSSQQNMDSESESEVDVQTIEN